MCETVERVQQDRKHVFVVNGDPHFLELIRELLQEQHFNVTTTNFVPRTFQQIRALEPDLIIVDLVIGEQAGWELLEELQRDAAMCGIPVIVTSTDLRFLDMAQRDQGRYGSNTYISKPLDIDELQSTIKGLVGKA